MNARTHALIVKVLALHGVIALIGSFVLKFMGKDVPVELLLVATTIVSGLTGHMAPHPKEEHETNSAV